MADTYLLALGAATDEQLIRAAMEAATTLQWLPKPGELAEIARQFETAYQKYRREADDLLRVNLRMGYVPSGWDEDLYRLQCSRLHVKPRSYPQGHMGGESAEDWLAWQYQFYLEMDGYQGE
jgi:hypothetical protein